jgi:hypothetical protein
MEYVQRHKFNNHVVNKLDGRVKDLQEKLRMIQISHNAINKEEQVPPPSFSGSDYDKVMNCIRDSVRTVSGKTKELGTEAAELQSRSAELATLRANVGQWDGILQANLFRDVAILFLRDYLTSAKKMQPSLATNPDFKKNVKCSQDMKLAAGNTAETGITDRVNAENILLVRRYNINIYHAQQYWLQWNTRSGRGKLGTEGQTKFEPRYTRESIDILIQKRDRCISQDGAELAVAKLVPSEVVRKIREEEEVKIAGNDIEEPLEYSAPYGTEFQGVQMVRKVCDEDAVRIAGNMSTSAGQDIEEQLEYCVLSAKTLGCSAVTSAPYGTEFQGVHESSIFAGVCM